MKIYEILFQVDTLTNLIESFNYIPSDLIWNGDIGYFSVNGEKFGATIIPSDEKANMTYSYFFNPVPKIGNIDFWMETEDEHTQDTTGLMKLSAFKVLSSVAEVIKELKTRHRYQILLCAAKRTNSPTSFPSRVSAYDTIVNRLRHKLKLNAIKLIDTPDNVIWVVFDNELYDGIVKVKEHMEKQKV